MPSSWKSILKLGVLTVLAIVGLSCGSPRVEGRLEPPFETYWGYEGSEYWITVDDSVAIEDLVDLSVFKKRGLRPGMNKEQVLQILGLAAEKHTIHRNLIAHRFQTPLGTIEVIESISQSDEQRGTNWFLRSECRLTSLFDATELLAELQGDAANSRVSLVAAESKVKLEFNNYRCENAWWMT